MTTPSGLASSARLLLDAPLYAQGWQDFVYLPNPGAGKQIVHKVDGAYWERLVCACFTLTTSGVAAARFVKFGAFDALGNPLNVQPASSGVAAGSALTISITSDQGYADLETSGYGSGVTPGLLLPPGSSWQTITLAMDAGDTYTGIVFVVHRFPSDIVTLPASS